MVQRNLFTKKRVTDVENKLMATGGKKGGGRQTGGSKLTYTNYYIQNR